jgi:alkyl hydroperoxide reductase subunit AhpF
VRSEAALRPEILLSFPEVAIQPNLWYLLLSFNPHFLRRKSMLTALEEKQILKLNDQLDRDVTIGLIVSEHPHFSTFKVFCDNLSRLVSGIKIKKDGDSPDEPPQILIGNGLRYQAVPAGHELQPFIEALIAFASDSLDSAETAQTLLKKERLPATLTLFIAPQCTFCPAVVRQLSPLPLLDDKIQ